MFLKNVTSNIIEEGQPVSLSCKSQAYPPALYAITKNNSTMIFNSTEGYFNIPSFGFRDEGLYECIPSNEIGEGTKRNIELLFGGKCNLFIIPLAFNLKIKNLFNFF